MIPITVHVRESRVEEFYVRFAEFIVQELDVAAPLVLPSGAVPTWIQTEDAPALASRLMSEMSGMGHFVLRHLIDGAQKQTLRLTPEELASLTQHPHGKSGVAGILGGVGKAIRRAGLPMYHTPNGRDTWHYVWGWDGVHYSMTPEVARLLKAARPR